MAKRQTTFYIEDEDMQQAKALGINCSEVAGEALRAKIAEKRSAALIEKARELAAEAAGNGWKGGDTATELRELLPEVDDGTHS